MRLCRLRAHAYAWVGLTLLCAIGCTNPPSIEPERYTDDFGADIGGGDPVTEASVGSTQMMRRRTRLDLRAVGVFPLESDFEPAAGARVAAEIEVQKNVFLGFSTDWARIDVDSEDDPVAATDGAIDRLDEFDRFVWLVTIGYETVLTPEFIKPDSPLSFRLGAGFGAAGIFVDENRGPFGTEDFDINSSFVFVARPQVDFRWQICPYAAATLGASIDLSPDEKLERSLNNNTETIDEEVNFSAINVSGGLIFEW